MKKSIMFLGCWVINHNFRGSVVNNSIIVSGSYDVNIWYSYLNNTKTNVMIKKFSYEYPMNVNIKRKCFFNKRFRNNSKNFISTKCY